MNFKILINFCLFFSFFVITRNSQTSLLNRSISSDSIIDTSIVVDVENKMADIVSGKIKLKRDQIVLGSKESRLRGSTQVTRKDIKNIAKYIFKLGQNISDEYPLGDGLTMAFYILRYFAQIGEYDLVQKDLLILIDTFEKMTGESLDIEIKDLVKQIKYLQFGKKTGQFFVKLYSNNPKKGLVIEIHQTIDDVPEIKEISKVTIKDGAIIKFKQYDTDYLIKRNQFSFITRKVTPGIYQVNQGLLDTYKSYFKEAKYPSKPMSLKFKGFNLFVSTNTIIKNVRLRLRDGISLPGIKYPDGKAIPSLIIRANSGISDLFVGIKASLEI